MKKKEMVRKSSEKERSERIANGTWMPRGAVYADKRKKNIQTPKHKGRMFQD